MASYSYFECRGADPNIETPAGLTILDFAVTGYGGMEQEQEMLYLLAIYGGKHGSNYSEEYMEDYMEDYNG